MIHTFNAPFVFTTKVTNHADIKQHLLPHILSYYNQNKNKQQCKWGTSQTITNHYDQDWSVYRQSDITDIIWNPFNQMLEELSTTNQFISGPPKQSKLSSLWWNIYSPNSFAPPHDHRGYDFSGAYFLHLTEPNTLCFQPYSFDGFFPTSSNDYLQTNTITEEGYVAIFPAYLLHYVNPCESQRVTISFNILSDTIGNRFH